ncbi:hypothetical protein K0B04_03370 [Patescibacteria group bacterium]|nr:hypothetical protein [Patescibacteria group bacterium]
MKKNISKISRYLLISLFVLFISNLSFAATLSLQKIGAMDTGGNTYPEWWYTGTSPVLSGVAEIGTDVTVKVNETPSSVTPDSSGAWSYTTQLDTGDHNIVISQGENSISFILHLGQTMPSGTVSETQESTTSVPETGFNQYVAISFGLGTILLATYFYFASDSNKKKVFETRMLKED